MFRARFTEAFPKSLPNFGPQELERDVVETIPGERVEQFLCALLSLLLNRKQDVKYVVQVFSLHCILRNALALCIAVLLTCVDLGLGITIARSRRRFKHTRANGPRTGMPKTLFLARPHFLP